MPALMTTEETTNITLRIATRLLEEAREAAAIASLKSIQGGGPSISLSEWVRRAIAQQARLEKE